MQQISNHIFCDSFIAELKLPAKLMPNPYYEFPYLIIKNFLSQEGCSVIVNDAKKQRDSEAAMVKRRKLGSIVDPTINDKIRRTTIVKLEESALCDYTSNFKIHQKQIESFFKIALTTSTKVQALQYTKGSFYIKHADDSNEVVNDTGETVGFVQVAPLRKLTTVLFGTSHGINTSESTFSGGELKFNYLFDKNGAPVILRPKAGDMVVFPSNPIFSHEVLPVTDGYRLTLVQWHNGIIA